MIIAIVNQHDNPDRTRVARNLAVLRARSGRRVCLMSTDQARGGDWCEERSAAGVQPWIDTRSVGSRAVKSRLTSLRLLFNDILIDAGVRDTEACRCVLACARLVLVPVRGHAIDLDCQYRLLARLHAARAFNPGLRVMFVAVSDSGGPDPDERDAILAHMARAPGATLAATVLHPGSASGARGLCACDRLACDPDGAAEMQNLYREVFAPAGAPAFLPEARLGAAHALWR